TGNILAQHEMDIVSDETAGQLHDRMMVAGADVVLKTLDEVRLGTSVETPQNHSIEHNPAPKIYKSTCEIDWNRSGIEIYNLIRGLSPYPAARTLFEGK
ncbi:MAG: methionyl-tRNA formyltransferase, partial [Bacteroidia bacterium]|nr:methionyl-tRNA formyltransferase [Bacteroidia bacterium]